MRGDDIFLRDVFSRRNFSSSIRETRCSRGASSDAAIVNRRTRSRRRDRDRGRGLERRSDRARGRKNPRMVRRPDGPRGRIGPPPSPRSSPQTETPRGVPTRGFPLRGRGARVDGVSRTRRRRRRRLGRLRRLRPATRRLSLALSPTGLVDQTARSSRPAYHSGGVSLRAGATRVSVRATVSEFETRRVAATLRFRGGTRRLPVRGSPSTSGRPGKDRRTYSLPSGTARAEDGRGRGRRRAGTRRRARRWVDRPEWRRTTRGVVRIPVTQRRRDPSLRLVEHATCRGTVPVAGIIPRRVG